AAVRQAPGVRGRVPGLEVVPCLLFPLSRHRRARFGSRSKPEGFGLPRRARHARRVRPDRPGRPPGERHAVVEGAARRFPDRAALSLREGPERRPSGARQTSPGGLDQMSDWPTLQAAAAALHGPGGVASSEDRWGRCWREPAIKINLGSAIGAVATLALG